MNNRIRNLWDDSSVPEELRQNIVEREARLAAMAAQALPHPSVAVFIWEFTAPCSVQPGAVYPTVGLFVGDVMVTCLDSRREFRN